jgi:hypothetical protein
MQKVYILQAQGFGDDENEFVNIGAFSTRANAEASLAGLIEEWEAEELYDVETRIEEFVLNA